MRSTNPLVQEADKVGGGAPTDGDSSQVHEFDVKSLCDGLSCFIISHLSLHIFGLGNIQVPDFCKFLMGQS